MASINFLISIAIVIFFRENCWPMVLLGGSCDTNHEGTDDDNDDEDRNDDDDDDNDEDLLDGFLQQQHEDTDDDDDDGNDNDDALLCGSCVGVGDKSNFLITIIF